MCDLLLNSGKEIVPIVVNTTYCSARLFISAYCTAFVRHFYNLAKHIKYEAISWLTKKLISIYLW